MAEKKVKNSTRLFFSGVVVLTISNLVIKAIGLLFKIPLHNLISGEGMGYYNAAYQIYVLFYMISTAGLPVATSIMISESRSLGKIDQVKKIFKISLGMFFVVGFVGMALMLVGANWFSVNVIKNEPTALCIMAIAPTLFFVCLSSAMRGYFQGYQKMLPVAISQLIEALSKLFLGIAFATYALKKYGSEPGALKYVAAFAILGLTVGAGLGMVYLTFTKMLFKSDKYDAEYLEESGEDHEVTKSSKIIKRIALIAIPITISSSVMSLTNLIDTVLIQNLLQTFRGFTRIDASAVYGNYTTLAVPMFNLPPVLVYPISYSLVPLVTAARTKGDHERAHRVMESALRVAVLIGIPCAIGLCALSEPILSLFYRDRAAITSTAPLLSLLAPSTFFLCVLSITNAMLQACGHERKPLISMAIGAVAKIGANIALLIFIGMPGTPISTFICYFTATVINMFFIKKHTGLKLRLSRVFVRPLIAGIFCGAAAYGSRCLFAIFLPGKIATILAILAAAAVYVTLIFVIKAIAPDDIELLPKGEKIEKIIKKLRLNTVASILIVCIVIGVVGGAGVLISGYSYKKAMNAAETSEDNKVSYYASAAKKRPLEPDAYFGLVEAMGEDGVFTVEEESILNKRLNSSIGDLSAKPFYGELSYDILRLYLSSYDPFDEDSPDVSNEYFLKKVGGWADNSLKYGGDSPEWSAFSTALSGIASLRVAVVDSDDDEGMTEEDYEKALADQKDHLDALSYQLIDEEDPAVTLSVSRIAAESFEKYEDGMIGAGVNVSETAEIASRYAFLLSRLEVPEADAGTRDALVARFAAIAEKTDK